MGNVYKTCSCRHAGIFNLDPSILLSSSPIPSATQMAVKLPLAVRKDIRDSWESVLPSYQERVKKCLGEDYVLEPNVEGLYAAAVDTDRVSQVGLPVKPHERPWLTYEMRPRLVR